MRHLVLACLVVAVAGCDDHGKSPCSGALHDPPDLSDPQIQFQVQRCRADASTCNDLCLAIMQQDMIEGMLRTCNVTFDAQGTPTVNLTYVCPTQTGVDAGIGPPPLVDAPVVVIVDAP